MLECLAHNRSNGKVISLEREATLPSEVLEIVVPENNGMEIEGREEIKIFSALHHIFFQERLGFEDLYFRKIKVIDVFCNNTLTLHG